MKFARGAPAPFWPHPDAAPDFSSRRTPRGAPAALRHHLVRIDHELLRGALVEILVSLRRFVE